MEPTRIVGIVLVRNEDFFVGQAVRNVAAFCDTLILCDHKSRDRTGSILRKLASELPNTSFHALEHPRESHELLKPFAGTRTWVFGVDGDEIYDPAGLESFRPRLLGGEFDAWWRMKGNVVHCLELDRVAKRARGHASPPSRSITKLYNFSAIKSWEGNTVERLHGGVIRFRPGWDNAMKLNIQDETAWSSSPLRCLHLCFLPRSANEAQRAPARENIMEIYRGGFGGKLRRFSNWLLGKRTPSQWKSDHYCRGELVTVDTSAFFCPR